MGQIKVEKNVGGIEGLCVIEPAVHGDLIESETLMEERKAEYFAALMLLGNLMPYFEGLKDMDFQAKAFQCMHLSQNVVEAFIDRIEVFNDERVKIRFTFEDVLAGYAE